MTIKRKLEAIGYPKSEININEENEFKNIISWLIKNKLNNVIASEQFSDEINWQIFYDQLKKSTQCPILIDNKQAELDWFLGLAVQNDYENDYEKYNKHTIEHLKQSNTPNIIIDNPLDNLNFTGKEFTDGINSIAKLLKVVIHPDPLITLEACSKIIQKRLNQQVLKNPKDYVLKGTPFPYESADLGFDLGDETLNRAAKLLRLLYVHDLRNLQTSANEVIVAVQSVTANPKTDTKLGKVGK